MKRTSVRAIMRDKNNKVCLIHRIKNGEEYWVIPGGGVEDGESLISAVKREMIEEIGSSIELDSDQPIFSFTQNDQEQHFFTCKELTRIAPTGDEHKENNPNNVYNIVFLEIDKLSNIKLVPSEIREKIISYAESSLDKIA